MAETNRKVKTFKFAGNYLHMTFPTTEQVAKQVEELIKVFTGEYARHGLKDKLNLINREYFRKNYLQPALNINGLIEIL